MDQYVSDAIASCLNQTYDNREIIVIDDGSKDNTRRVVSRFGKAVSYYYQRNSGVSAARNLGIKKAKGHYISFLDADDIWLPSKLERQIAAINNNPSIRAISCGYIFMNENGKIIKKRVVRANYKNRKDQYRAISIWQLIPGSSSGMLLQRECFHKAGLFDEALFIGEDWDMWIRIAEFSQIHYIEDVLAIFRIRERSDEVRSIQNDQLRSEEVIVQNVKKRYRNRAYAALYARLGSSCLSACKFNLAIHFLYKSLLKWPLPIFPMDLKNKYMYPKIPRYYLLAKAVGKMHH